MTGYHEMDRIRAYIKPSQSSEERKLVQKIDFFILTFCCLSYFCNYVRPYRCYRPKCEKTHMV